MLGLVVRKGREQQYDNEELIEKSLFVVFITTSEEEKTMSRDGRTEWTRRQLVVLRWSPIRDREFPHSTRGYNEF